MAVWRDRLTGRRSVGAVAASAGVLFATLAFATSAAAQGAGPYYDDESVVVDLSVLDDGGFGRRAAKLPPAGVVPRIDGSMQMPGREMPRSRFHGLEPGTGRTTAALARPPAAAAKSRPAAAVKTAASPPARPPVEKRATTTQPPPPPAGIPAQPPAPPVIMAMPQPSPPAPAPTPEPVAPQQMAATSAPAAPTLAPAAPRSIAAPPAPVASLALPPPAPPSPPAAAPEAKPAQPSPAALPLAPAISAKDLALQVGFPAGDSRLPASAHDGLKGIAERMKSQENLRLQIFAYAAGDDLSASAARRLSLSRALAVRTHLIENGVRSTRIDVRALGDKVADQPANRVDLTFSDR